MSSANDSDTSVVPPELDDSMLSQQEQSFFAEFGYLIKRQLFTPSESQRILDEFNATIDEFVERPRALETAAEHRERAGDEKVGVGQRHDGSARTMIGGPIEHRMAWILDHPKVLGLLQGVIGVDFNVRLTHRSVAVMRCDTVLRPSSQIAACLSVVLIARSQYCSGDGNYYSGDTSWHPDGNWGQLFAVKVAFYLDTLDAASGCVRLIPGSHRPDHPVRTSQGGLAGLMERTGTSPETLPWGIAVPTQLGDVVMFNHGKLN